MHKLLLPALVSSGVVSFLALETQFDRLDRVVLFLILFATYLFAFIGITTVLRIGLRVFTASNALRPDSRRSLECFLFLGPLLVNILLAIHGHKDIVFATKPVLAGWLTLQIASTCAGLLILYVVLLAIYRVPKRGRRWAAATLLALVPLAILLPCPGRGPTRVDAAPAPAQGPTNRLSEAPIVLVGLDGIDSRLLEAGITTGRLPSFRAFIEKGFVSQLDFGEIALSPIVWTSLATGKTRFQHGIHDFVTIRSPLFRRELGTWFSNIPPGFGVKSVMAGLRRLGLVTERVANGLDRRGPSIWQLLSAHDLNSIVVNYMVSWPAEQIKGVFISQYFYHRSVNLPKVQPTAISPAVNLPSFGFEQPRGVVEQLGPTPPKDASALPTELGEAEFEYMSEIALLLAQRESFDLMTFYTHWPDTFNHAMAPADYESALSGEFSTEVSGELLMCLERIDRFLKELQQRAKGANFIVVSDHGVQLGHDGRQEIVQHAHAPAGIFLGVGPDIVPRKEGPLVSVLDVAPTLLTYFGLPVGADMEGELLGDLFGIRGEPIVITSYDDFVENRRVKPDETPDLSDVEERLRSLGYLQ